MDETEWILIDTETTGLVAPIYVIEIAAQRMRGWDPVGERFHCYLDHGVRVPPEATAVNHITTEFLRSNGSPPLEAHAAYADYVGDRPVASHSLSYDWDRCLRPERERLRQRPAGTRGFCTMLLSRRVLPEARSVSLDVLRVQLGISSSGAHSASGDVDTVLDLVRGWFRPRLEAAGISTLADVMKFSRTTPIRKCHALLGHTQGRS